MSATGLCVALLTIGLVTTTASADQHQHQHQHQHPPASDAPSPSPADAAPGGPPDAASPAAAPPTVVPITDEMRRAAFPDVQGHAAHDRVINSFVLFDELEWRRGADRDGLAWRATGWVGGDVNRFWFRTEGDAERGDVGDAEAHLLYGRAVARWWDVVAGIRQDVRPAAQTWLAAGIQGLAPGFFDVEATAYLSDAGQLAARVEVEYDLLVTNRLVLQPTAEANVYSRTNTALGVGTGVSSAEVGLRLRYQVRREVAPYVGVSWVRPFGRTRALNPDGGGARLVTGVRLWF